MASGEGGKGVFSKLRTLAIALDKTLPQVKQDLLEAKRNYTDESPLLTEELKNRKLNLQKMKEKAEVELLEIKEANDAMAKKLEVNKIKIASIENEVSTIVEFLTEYGLTIEDFERITEVKQADVDEESAEPPEQNDYSTPDGKQDSKTPDLESFCLSMSSLRFLHSSSADTAQKPAVQKSLFTAAGMENLPKFNLDATPGGEAFLFSENAMALTPETPELTVYSACSFNEMNSMKQVNDGDAGKANAAENLIPEEPELTCHYKPPNDMEDRFVDDLPLTPKFSLKYNFM